MNTGDIDMGRTHGRVGHRAGHRTGTSPEQLLAACIAGEWADRGDFESCRLVSVEWPSGFSGPAFAAVEGVTVGAILKPALGLTPAEAGRTAARLVDLGATLVKDDELRLECQRERY